MLQQVGLAEVDAVGTVAAQLLGNALHVVAQQNAVQLGVQLVGQLAALGNELVGGVHHDTATLLTENPYAAVKCGDIGTIVVRHIVFLPSIR